MYVEFDYTHNRSKRTGTGLNHFWLHKFDFKSLLGLEPMKPIRPQFLAQDNNHLATEMCMYVCIYVCVYVCICVYMHECVYTCIYMCVCV